MKEALQVPEVPGCKDIHSLGEGVPRTHGAGICVMRQL